MVEGQERDVGGAVPLLVRFRHFGAFVGMLLVLLGWC